MEQFGKPVNWLGLSHYSLQYCCFSNTFRKTDGFACRWNHDFWQCFTGRDVVAYKGGYSIHQVYAIHGVLDFFAFLWEKATFGLQKFENPWSSTAKCWTFVIESTHPADQCSAAPTPSARERSAHALNTRVTTLFTAQAQYHSHSVWIQELQQPTRLRSNVRTVHFAVLDLPNFLRDSHSQKSPRNSHIFRLVRLFRRVWLFLARIRCKYVIS